jgi:hypothetical protein
MNAVGHIHPLGSVSYNKAAAVDLSFSRIKKPSLTKKVARIFDSIPFSSNSNAMNGNGKFSNNKAVPERSAACGSLQKSFLVECQHIEKELEESDEEYFDRFEQLEELKANLQDKGNRLNDATVRSWRSYPDLTIQIIIKILDQKLKCDDGKNFIERFFIASQKFLRKLNHYLVFVASHDFKEVEKFEIANGLGATSLYVESLISPSLTIEMRLMLEEILSYFEDVYENLGEDSDHGQIPRRVLKVELDKFKNFQNALKKIEEDWEVFHTQLKNYCLSVREFEQFEKDYANHIQELLKRLNQAEQMQSSESNSSRS